MGDHVSIRKSVLVRIEAYLIDVCKVSNWDTKNPDRWYTLPLDEMFQVEPELAPYAKLPMAERKKLSRVFRDEVNWELGLVHSEYRVLVEPVVRSFMIKLVNTYYLGGMSKFKICHP